MSKFLYFVIPAFLFSAAVKSQGLAKGSYLFSVEYLDSIKAHQSSPMALPSHLMSTFQGQDVRTDIISEYVSSNSFVNLKTRHFDDYMTAGDKKVMLTGSLDSLISKTSKRSSYTLKEEPGEKVFLGLKCKKAKAHFEDSQIPDAEIWYYPDLPWLPNPLIMQFPTVKGLIVDLTSQFQGIGIHLKLEKIYQDFSSQMFSRPQGYTVLSVSDALNKLATTP